MKTELNSLSNFENDDTVYIIQNDYGIYPYNKFRQIWEYLIFFVSFVCLWDIPFEILINPNRSSLYIIVMVFIDFLYFIDIIIVQRTGIIQNGVMKMDRKTILRNIPKVKRCIYYLSPWPYYLIGWMIGNDNVFFALLLLKLLRMYRLHEAMNTITDTLIYMNMISKMFNLFCKMFTIMHFSACIFWYTGFLEIPNKSWLVEANIIGKPRGIQYFHSLYYITTTTLTIGYGDLHPYTFKEVCVVILIEAVGVFYYNYVVSNMVSVVADPSRNYFLRKYERIFSAFKNYEISDETTEELMRYYEYVWERDHDRQDFYETASKMPEGLQKKLAIALHQDVFNKLDVFRNADIDILKEIAITLKPRIFTPGDILVKAGRVSNKMFFVSEGSVDLMNYDGEIIRSFTGNSTGNVFGESSIISGQKELYYVVARTYVEAFELSKEDFDEIALMCPRIQINIAIAKANHDIYS